MVVIVAQEGTLGGSALASWTPLWLLLGGFAAVVVFLVATGRSDARWGRLALLSRAPERLERLTGLPGWAASAIGTSLFGLLVAGQGFYSDVAWHIALGRDKALFTAPHTSILLGLLLILGGAVLGTMTATLSGRPGGWRILGLRVPRSVLPLWVLGLGAVSGFPMDEIWHEAFGVDVTMWSPTHMLMILGATFTPAAVWLVLGATGVRPTSSRWGRGLHVACALLTLLGLAAPLGEFSFGVPQFPALFAPVLVVLAAAVGLVAARVVLGPYWTFGLVAVSAALGGGSGGGPVTTRSVASFVGAAVVVELAGALWAPGRRPWAFAAAAGVGIGTLGLGWEWWWNQGARQPWETAMLPAAASLGLVVAVAGSAVGLALAQAVDPAAIPSERPTVRTGLRRAALGGAAVCAAVLVALLPRTTGDVRGKVSVTVAQDGTAMVAATLSPPDAADDALWFQTAAWQGGGLVLADMVPTGNPGEYRSERPVPVGGSWKTLLRLHTGRNMMTIPIYLPADAEIGKPEIPAVDRSGPFESERRYLLRESTDGGARWLSFAVHGYLAAVVAVWFAGFALATRRRPEVGAERVAAPVAA